VRPSADLKITGWCCLNLLVISSSSIISLLSSSILGLLVFFIYWVRFCEVAAFLWLIGYCPPPPPLGLFSSWNQDWEVDERLFSKYLSIAYLLVGRESVDADLVLLEPNERVSE
jgi:hypothetical protein